MLNRNNANDKPQPSDELSTHRVLLPRCMRWLRCNAALAAKWKQIIGGEAGHVEELETCAK